MHLARGLAPLHSPNRVAPSGSKPYGGNEKKMEFRTQIHEEARSAT